MALAVRILGESRTVGEASKRFSSETGRYVADTTLAHAFRRFGLKKPRFYMFDGPEVPVTVDLSGLWEPSAPPTAPTVPRVAPSSPAIPADPVEAAQVKRAARDLKGELETLTELLRLEREKNAFYTALGRPRERLTIKPRERTSGVREMTALVLASDWHPEEEVSPIKVQGRNKFTLDIARLRIQRFFDGIVDLITHHRASGKIVIRDLVLALMGDLMTGHIHEDCKHLTKLFPIETILWLTPQLEAGIRYLLKELDLASIKIPCDVGNHGRTTEYRNIATGPETSYEYGMYVTLQRAFAGDPRVEFDTSPSNDHYTQIYDFLLHTTHGDSLRYAGGVGGLTIPLLKAVSSWDSDIRADWHAIGHFHTALDVDKAICNGSMIGWSPFGKWIKARYNARDLSQHFSLIDRGNGRCHSTLIWVASRKDELAFWSEEEKAMIRLNEREAA